MIELDGIMITETMKKELRAWQEEDWLQLAGDIEAINNAICFIASEHETPSMGSDEALRIIADLSFLRKKLKHFNGIECR